MIDNILPGVTVIAMVVVALVGLSNAQPVHAREHILDMLPWAILFILFPVALLLSR